VLEMRGVLEMKSIVKRGCRFRLLFCFLFTLGLNMGVQAEDASGAIDPTSGLIIADHWELARAHCGACHSYRLVTANRGDRTYWLDTLRWMQRTQNLWPIPADQESALLDYLAANYSESEWGRRPPLSPALLPASQPGQDTTSER